jgi:hypothetical protein
MGDFNVTYEIVGLSRLQRELKEAGIDATDLKKAGQKAAKIVMAEAKRTAPVRTGALKKSLRVAASKNKAGVLAGNLGNLPYAPPIHWGWPDRGIRANPWVSRAAVMTQSQWLPGYIAEIDKALEKVRGAPRGGSR